MKAPESLGMQLQREMDEVDALNRLRAMIEGGDDVMRVVKLEAIEGGRFRYLIETPFRTWPLFVIGTTDAEITDVRILLTFGSKWSALEKWDSGFGK